MEIPSVNPVLAIANMNIKNRFIITCHGWSASNWTAHALSLNRNVVCTHSARNELADDQELHTAINLKRNIKKFQEGYKLRQHRSLDMLYEEIEEKGQAEYFGSVHVLRLRDLPVLYRKYGIPARKFQVANVVRHPINLVWSGYGQFKDLFRIDINELHWTTGKIVGQALGFANRMAEKYSVRIGDFEHLAFLGACAVLAGLKEDLQVYPAVANLKGINFAGTFQMEELTTNQGYFQAFLEKLEMEDIVDEQYIGQVMGTKSINKHKHDNKYLSPLQRFQSFTPMQREIFTHFFNLHELRETYKKFGYDLSMVAEAP